jgi:hypothetical protein
VIIMEFRDAGEAVPAFPGCPVISRLSVYILLKRVIGRVKDGSG